MSADPVAVLIQRVRAIAGALPGPEVSDRELLQRFASRRDESAFETLLRRHGPIVLRVRLWDVAAGKEVRQLDAQTKPDSGSTMSPSPPMARRWQRRVLTAPSTFACASGFHVTIFRTDSQ